MSHSNKTDCANVLWVTRCLWDDLCMHRSRRSNSVSRKTSLWHQSGGFHVKTAMLVFCWKTPKIVRFSKSLNFTLQKCLHSKFKSLFFLSLPGVIPYKVLFWPFEGCFEPVLNWNDKLRRNLAHRAEFKIKTMMWPPRRILFFTNRKSDRTLCADAVGAAVNLESSENCSESPPTLSQDSPV